MKQKFLLLIILLLPKLGMAQMFSGSPITINNISFSAHKLVPLNFNYATIDEMLAPKIINNAIRLDLCINTTGSHVYAKLIYESAPGTAPQNWVKKIWTHDNSPNALIHSNESVLSTSDVLLFTQPSDGQNTAKNYSYYYNLGLNPLTTFVACGQYNFKILYTMTIP